MPVKYGTVEYWKRLKEIHDWEAELQSGTASRQERREIAAIVVELKEALKWDTYGN